METLINIQFNHKGKDYEFVLDLSKFEDESDYWDTLYGVDVNGNDISFDLNYDEEYNTIAVYPIDMDTLETDYQTTIHRQPIFTLKEYMKNNPDFEIGSFPLDFKEDNTLTNDEIEQLSKKPLKKIEGTIRCTLNVIRHFGGWENFCKTACIDGNENAFKDTQIFEIKKSTAIKLGII